MMLRVLALMFPLHSLSCWSKIGIALLKAFKIDVMSIVTVLSLNFLATSLACLMSRVLKVSCSGSKSPRTWFSPIARAESAASALLSIPPDSPKTIPFVLDFLT